MISDKNIDILLNWADDKKIPENDNRGLISWNGKTVNAGFPRDREVLRCIEVLDLA